MGQNRASIKIEFTMYGHTEKADMWINWSPDDFCTERGPYYVDYRVLEFFNAAVGKCEDAHREREQARIERARIQDWTDGTF
jgi:hypothetical protein